MTTDPFTEAARKQARWEWDFNLSPMSPTPVEDLGQRMAEWARTHLAAQEPDMAEQEARWVVEHKHQFRGSQCVCGFETERARTRTEHIMTHYFDELSALRAARRERERKS